MESGGIESTIQQTSFVYLAKDQVDNAEELLIIWYGEKRRIDRFEDAELYEIPAREFSTYLFPSNTVSAFWATRHHDAPTEYYLVTQEGNEYRVFRKFTDDWMPSSELYPLIIGYWTSEEAHIEWIEFNGFRMWDSEHSGGRPYMVEEGYRLIISDNPDEEFSILSISNEVLVIEDVMGNQYTYFRNQAY